MLKAGSRIADYVVEQEIGVGSTSVVYRIRPRGGRRRFALKVLSLGHPEVFQRMLREGRLMAALDHPHIVKLLAIIDVEGMPGLVMEWVAGPSLEGWLHTRSEAPLAVRHALAERLVAGVAHAHAAGVIHRDLKPANVLLHVGRDPVPVPRITDFGLAKLLGDRDRPSYTRTGHALGTPRYMAPEQIRSAKHVDLRADVFSLGCVLYELYCRRLAFPQTDMLSVFNAVCNGEFVDPTTYPEVPAPVAGVLRDALSVDPARRPRDARELHARLWGTQTPRPRADVTRRRRGPVPPNPDPQWTSAAALGVGGLVGGAIAAWLIAAAVAGWWWWTP